MIPEPPQDANRCVQVGATKTLFDDIIDRHAEAFKEAYKTLDRHIEFSDFELSGTSNYYIGMVWTNDGEKPNVDQLKIRGSLNLCKNKLVELDVSAVTSQQSFFPGQIVAFQAYPPKPGDKNLLRVREFLDSSKVVPSLKSINTIEKLNILVAAGPFMTPDSDDWTLFDSLVSAIKANDANRIIITGPLVDLQNKPISSKYDQAWTLIVDKLIEHLYDYECRIYLVPSGRDILPSYFNSNYIYPCPKLEIKLTNIKESVKLSCSIESVPDPAQIDLGGLYLDVTSAEILFHMNGSLSFINKDAGNRFESIYKHIISHGIYPLHPPSHDIAIDYPSLAGHLKLDRLGAHLVVLPTRFGSSTSVVEDRLVVTLQKCCVTKQAILIEVPVTESSHEHPITSLAAASFTQKTIQII